MPILLKFKLIMQSGGGGYDLLKAVSFGSLDYRIFLIYREIFEKSKFFGENM